MGSGGHWQAASWTTAIDEDAGPLRHPWARPRPLRAMSLARALVRVSFTASIGTPTMRQAPSSPRPDDVVEPPSSAPEVETDLAPEPGPGPQRRPVRRRRRNLQRSGSGLARSTLA